jgi:hypothetical protein
MSDIKKGAKKTAKKKRAKKTARLAAAMPRREDIHGIEVDLPDISNWKEAARVLRIRPFYMGPSSLPFSCLEATQMRLDKKRGNVTYSYVNDFRVAERCVRYSSLAGLQAYRT